MSDPVRSDRAAFDELQALVGMLAEELAGFRTRALSAEQKLKAATKQSGSPSLFEAGALQARLSALETENADLQARLAAATDRTRAMLDRVRFLRQQAAPAEVDA